MRRVINVTGMRMPPALTARTGPPSAVPSSPSVTGRARRVPAVLAAGAVLLAAACAPAGAERPFTPRGDAPTAGGPGASPGASGAPGALSVPQVREVEAAPGLTVSVEWPAGLDAAGQAMVQTFADGYVGSWRAVATQGEDTSYLTGIQDEAGRDAYTWVRGFVNRRQSATGTAKVYAVRVASVTGPGAEVDACVDESGIRVTEARTGRPISSQPAWTKPPKSVYLQVAALRRGDDGSWRVKAYMHAAYPHQRAKECRR
ncbi:hypothetical protein [Sphaerisporangium sp. TRM90804]|uniref:hypothetical protein n=1 Tax=Sphaerisporangium sp. TRM90804 TaxID=3031113 RepID=UPI002449EF7A|nr:hypothetical protein [Sphaerisporangium sp. TRM90804]MDH2423957.1 hypothetical protein [Sphaerisporangium sp. TRM90804]